MTTASRSTRDLLKDHQRAERRTAGPGASQFVTKCLRGRAVHPDKRYVVDHGGRSVAIPRFGGTARAWTATLACVRDKLAPFDVDIVDERPTDDPFIHVIVGGTADQLGYDPDTTAGVGESDGRVLRTATAHVFSRSIGEADVKTLCDTTAHEIGHTLGLDHSMQCGDLMSYPRPECDSDVELTFTDVDAACGESEDRTCEDGAATQNSFAKLARLVGLREGEGEGEPPPPTAADDEPTPARDPWPRHARRHPRGRQRPRHHRPSNSPP